MSRIGERFRLAAFLVILAMASTASLALDLVVLRDGSELRGTVVSLDRGRLVLDRDDGKRESVDRIDVRRIEFGEVDAPPIKARVIVNEGDDEVRLFLDGKEFAQPAELEAGWFDISPLLQEGANQISAEVRNEAGTWSYRWTLEVGSDRHVFSCGLRGRTGCNNAGAEGTERGTMPAGRAWVFVKRRAGEAKLQVEAE